MQKRRILRFALAAAAAVVLAGVFFAQGPSPDANLAKDLKWRNIGPANMVGRISAFDAVEKDFTQVLVGAAGGGVFKSTNAGTTWEPIFDKYGASSIGDVAFFQKDPNIIWIGTGEECVRNSVAWGDGVYKSTDGGKTFTRMGLETTQTIGRVVPHPTDPDICYVAASGHPWGYTGDRGLFKTTDGGKTWVKLAGGLPNDGKTGAIDLVMDPANSDVLYVSFWQRLRQPWRFDSGGPNGGIFKTTDAGKTWAKLTQGLPAGEVGRIGLAIARSNPKVIEAVVEHGFQPSAGGGQRGGGMGGAPGGAPGGGGGAPAPAQPNPDYADMTKLGTGVYRTEDGGATWKFMSRNNNRPFYYSHIYINPSDDKLIYFLTTSLSYSEDGGKTWKQMTGLHPDFHAMWLDPTNRNRFYVGQDGGASITYDHGKTWVYYDNLCFSQFYAVSTDMRDPYWVYGGLQDNGTWGGPSMSREGAILTDFWFNFTGGDGFHTQNDPTDWRIVYSESQGGSAQRTNVETRESKSIRPGPQNVVNYADFYPPAPAAPAPAPGALPSGRAGEAPAKPAVPPAKPSAAAPAGGGQRGQAAALPSGRTGVTPAGQQTGGGQFGGMGGGARSTFRFNWSTPIYLSPHNPSIVYMGGQHLFRSENRGDTWMIISPDLTTNDKTKFGVNSGGTDKPTGGITSDVTGAETHCTIISISESPKRPGLIWVGTDDGNVQITRNGGVAWTNVRPNFPADLPKGIWCSRVEASHFDEGTAYATFDGHRSDNFKPFVYKTTDYGKTWTAIAVGIPDTHPVYVIREDFRNKNLLFLGTEFGAFFSINAGKTWTSLQLNLPTVAVHDLLIHPRDNDLIAATHGRGFWIMDDISALQGATDAALASDAFLFESARPVTRWLRIQRGGYGRGNLFFQGENPPQGALIHYYVKDKLNGPLTIEISDVTGLNKTIFSFDNPKTGINRLVWDMRFDPRPEQVQSAISAIKQVIQTAASRAELSDEQKAAVQDALKQIDASGGNYRRVTEIQRNIQQQLGLGGGFMGGGGGGGGFGGQRGGFGGGTAEPGVYAVKMTANGKTTTGKITIRLDPIQNQ
jgi:photosystem II stability/assembly factor-like uncharacterized protein